MKQQRKNSQELVIKSNRYDESYSNGPVSCVKVIDKNGFSIQPVDGEYKRSKYIKSDVKISKDGFKPYVCYPDSEITDEPTVIKVVKKYGRYEQHMHNARKALVNEANRISNYAAEEYHDACQRGSLTTEKNLISAKITALRLTNKAMILEKEYTESNAEEMRHQQVLSDIEKLKLLLLENNEINLKEAIAEINLNRELDLDNAKSNKENVSKKIAEQIEINKIKNEYMKERIKILASGQTPVDFDKEMQEEIERVKKAKSFRERDDEELEILYLTLKSIGVENIADPDDKLLAINVIEKFESDKRIRNLNAKYIQETKNKNANTDEVNEVKTRMIKSFDKKYAAPINVNVQKKITLNARKATLSISMSPEKLMATQQRTLHVMFEDFPVVNNKKSAATKKEEAKKEEARREEAKREAKLKEKTEKQKVKKEPSRKENEIMVVKQAKPSKKAKAKKDVSTIEPSFEPKRNSQAFPNNDYLGTDFTHYDLDDDFFSQRKVINAIKKWKKIESYVQQHDDYDVRDYDKNAYQINYEDFDYNDFLDDRQPEPTKQSKNKKNDFKPEDLIEYYPESKLAALRKRLERLPNEPAIYNSKNSYEYKHLMAVIAKLSSLPLKRLPKTPENDNFIIEIQQILDFYESLIDRESVVQANIAKSMQLDNELKAKIYKEESSLSSMLSENDLRYQKDVSGIEIESANALDKAHLDYEQQKQQINTDIALQLENEAKLHEKNKAFIKTTSRNLLLASAEYENDLIDNIVKEINAYNARQTEERYKINITSLPTKIECKDPITDVRLDLIGQDDGVYAISRTFKDGKVISYTAKAINETLPTNVTKVVVLDKFRSIVNPLKRAEALKELATSIYQVEVEINTIREKEEADDALLELKKSKKISDELIDESYILNEYLELTKSKSRYCNFVQNEHLKRAETKWKITEANLKRQYNLESAQAKRAENQNKKLENAQKKIDAKREKYLSSIHNEVTFDNIRYSNGYDGFDDDLADVDNSLVLYYNKDYSDSKKDNNSFKKKFKSWFSSKDEDDIEDIIGRKK